MRELKLAAAKTIESTGGLQSARQRTGLNPAHVPNSPDDLILFLQGTAGNQAVESMFNSGLTTAGRTTGHLSRATTQQEEGVSEDKDAVEKPMSREDEIRLSHTSPGRITGSVNPLVITLYNFAINSSVLKPECGPALAEVADLIRYADAGKTGVVVAGHADMSGATRDNLPLSQCRAMAVKQSLERVAGRNVTAEWSGDSMPAASNNTVEGRSRNRRVDIHFVAKGGVHQPSSMKHSASDRKGSVSPPVIEESPGKRESQDTEDDGTFCIKHPLICAALGIGAAGGAAVLYCVINPFSCLPKAPVSTGGACGGPEKPEENNQDEKKQEHPCVASVSLPSSTIKAKVIPGFMFWKNCLVADFTMELTFKEDNTGCSCRLGEYKQEIRGFAERDDGTGVMRPADPPNLKLDRNKYQEDQRGHMGPYGVRLSLTHNRDEDKYLPRREDGCLYQGWDKPGMLGGLPGEHVRFRFEFRGGAVDRRDRSVELGQWHNWIVEGDHTFPKSTPPAPSGQTPFHVSSLLPPHVPRPESEVSRIGPAPPSAKAPEAVCDDGSIGDITFKYLKEQQKEKAFLDKEDMNQAVDLEFDFLKMHRLAPFISDPNNREDYQGWILELKSEAHDRVVKFAGDHFMPFPD